MPPIFWAFWHFGFKCNWTPLYLWYFYCFLKLSLVILKLEFLLLMVKYGLYHVFAFGIFCLNFEVERDLPYIDDLLIWVSFQHFLAKIPFIVEKVETKRHYRASLRCFIYFIRKRYFGHDFAIFVWNCTFWTNFFWRYLASFGCSCNFSVLGRIWKIRFHHRSLHRSLWKRNVGHRIQIEIFRRKMKNLYLSSSPNRDFDSVYSDFEMDFSLSFCFSEPKTQV